MAEIGPFEKISLNNSAYIQIQPNGDVLITTGTDSLPGSEFTLTAGGQVIANGQAVGGGGSAQVPPGAARVGLTDTGIVTIQTGVDGAGSLFSFTPEGKVLKDGVEYGGASPAQPAGPGAWVVPVLLNGWKHASTLNSYAMEQAKYRLNGDRLEFAGMLDGTAAPAPSQTNIMFRLPTAIANRLQYQKTIQVVVNGNVTGSVKLLGNAVTYVAGVQNTAGGTATLNLGGCSATLDS